MATILFVEDDEELQTLVRIALHNTEHTLVSSPDGLDALRQVNTLKPDLVLLDLMMPMASGDAVLGWLRSTDSLRSVPVIVISAHPKAETIADQLQADAFFAKPVNITALRQTIEEMLVRSS